MSFGSKICGCSPKIETIIKTVCNNTLTCRCRVCGYFYELSLMPIKKKIIYLDQWVFSQITKNSFAFKDRLETLAQKQVIVCPYSDVHDKETHLAGPELAPKLCDTIRILSRNKRFKHQSSIKEQQILNAFCSYIAGGPVKYQLDLNDAIGSSIHDWDRSMRVDLAYSLAEFQGIDALQKQKTISIQLVQEMLPFLRKSRGKFNDYYKYELEEHENVLLSAIESLRVKDLIETSMNENCRIINTLLLVNGGENDIDGRIEEIKNFLKSNYFANVPYVNISSALWAFIREEVATNRFLTVNSKLENIKKDIRGIVFDIEHLSVFAPYCDLIYIEKRMAKWLSNWCQDPRGGYLVKIYSPDNKDEFSAHLEEIESSISSNMVNELKIVFG